MLYPAGKEAAPIAELFWWMLGCGIIIWLIMMILAVYTVRIKPERHDARRPAQFIIGGGVVFSTVVPTTLLVSADRSDRLKSRASVICAIATSGFP